MTKHEEAIYASLPIIHNALEGALDKEIALKWIEFLLNKSLET